jgi:hypothetical protein
MTNFKENNILHIILGITFLFLVFLMVHMSAKKHRSTCEHHVRAYVVADSGRIFMPQWVCADTIPTPIQRQPKK